MNARTPADTTCSGTGVPCLRDDIALVEAAQGGDQLAFERLLRRHQGLLDAQASRFYLPGGDRDDVAQEARVGFMKAVRFYRGGRGSSFRTFAELCVARQLTSALTAATRAKHRPLSESARGDQAERTLAALPDREEPLDQLVASDRLGDLVRQAGEFSELERNALGHALAGWSSGEAARRLGSPRLSTDNALQRAITEAGPMASALGGVSASGPMHGAKVVDGPLKPLGRRSHNPVFGRGLTVWGRRM